MGNPASAIVILSVCPKRAITLEIELLSNTPFSSLPPQRNVSLFYIVGNENRENKLDLFYIVKVIETFR